MSCITVRTTDLYIAITYLPADLLSVSAVSSVVKELRVVQKKWRTIGEELGVKKYVLDRIHTNYSDAGNRLSEVLSERVSHHTTTWGDIVDALRSPHVGQSQLADQLEAKYCPSELSNLHCSTPNAVEGCLPTHCVCQQIVMPHYNTEFFHAHNYVYTKLHNVHNIPLSQYKLDMPPFLHMQFTKYIYCPNLIIIPPTLKEHIVGYILFLQLHVGQIIYQSMVVFIYVVCAISNTQGSVSCGWPPSYYISIICTDSCVIINAVVVHIN